MSTMEEPQPQVRLSLAHLLDHGRFHDAFLSSSSSSPPNDGTTGTTGTTGSPFHKIIFAQSSGVVAQTMTLKLDCEGPEVWSVPFSQAACRAALAFAYGSERVPPEDVAETLSLALFLDMPGLVRRCEEIMSSCLDSATVWQMLMAGQRKFPLTEDLRLVAARTLRDDSALLRQFLAHPTQLSDAQARFLLSAPGMDMDEETLLTAALARADTPGAFAPLYACLDLRRLPTARFLLHATALRRLLGVEPYCDLLEARAVGLLPLRRSQPSIPPCDIGLQASIWLSECVGPIRGWTWAETKRGGACHMWLFGDRESHFGVLHLPATLAAPVLCLDLQYSDQPLESLPSGDQVFHMRLTTGHLKKVYDGQRRCGNESRRTGQDVRVPECTDRHDKAIVISPTWSRTFSLVPEGPSDDARLSEWISSLQIT